jgi:hypothetical protein
MKSVININITINTILLLLLLLQSPHGARASTAIGQMRTIYKNVGKRCFKDCHTERKRLKRERREKVGEVAKDTTFKGEKQEVHFFLSGFEGSQAVPARPSGRGMLKRG